MKITDFESFLQCLGIPNKCELNKPIFKKMFLDNGALDATDKKCLKDDVDKVRWLYTLKPSTINIAPYNDNQREYPEVAVLHVELLKPERFKRIAHFINRSIPYPLVLLFTSDVEGQASLAIGLADKRINQADKEKWVIEDSIQTDWFDFSDQSEAATEFLASLTVSNLPFQNFWKFYQALNQRVIAINCASHSGEFSLGGSNQTDKADDRLAMLRKLESLEAEKLEIANKLKKEKQMGKQVEMNTQIKELNDKIAKIKGKL
ncbi:MAG: hypothetical protein COA78_24180 [Blastopirellula sp.]|nr:MAG: hypothetical protein COA78_24180 [Blastopirellula sp.]